MNTGGRGARIRPRNRWSRRVPRCRPGSPAGRFLTCLCCFNHLFWFTCGQARRQRHPMSSMLLSCSWRAWEFAGMGFRMIAVAYSFEASTSASEGPILLFAWSIVLLVRNAVAAWHGWRPQAVSQAHRLCCSDWNSENHSDKRYTTVTGYESGGLHPGMHPRRIYYYIYIYIHIYIYLYISLSLSLSLYIYIYNPHLGLINTLC